VWIVLKKVLGSRGCRQDESQPNVQELWFKSDFVQRINEMQRRLGESKIKKNLKLRIDTVVYMIQWLGRWISFEI